MIALAIYTVFCVAVGAVGMWMWTRYDIQNVQAELDDLYVEYAEANARQVAAEAVAYQRQRLLDMFERELELERIVSESYAAGIARQER